MESLLTGGRGLDLRAVTVRPTWGAQEHRRWDKLVATHHYLSFQGLFGKGLRHVATLGSTWIALIGWQAGALKLTARDRWIGWSREQKLRRLHLVTQNSRFVILPGFHAPNLASRVLGLSLRRLSDDMLAAHGYPVLVAETFVDPARFAGTCYRAANWRSLGMTGGYARQRRVRRRTGSSTASPRRFSCSNCKPTPARPCALLFTHKSCRDAVAYRNRWSGPA